MKRVLNTSLAVRQETTKKITKTLSGDYKFHYFTVTSFIDFYTAQIEILSHKILIVVTHHKVFLQTQTHTHTPTVIVKRLKIN